MSVGHIGQLCLYIKSHKALLTLTYSLTHVSVTERKRERGVTHTHPTVTSSPRLKWWRNWAQIGNLISVYLCLCGVCVCVCREYTHTYTAWGIESTLPNDTTTEAAVYFSVCGSFLWTLIHQVLVSYIFNYTHVWHMSLDPWRINMNWISN